ncbi:MAG: FtsW/RodA/SpoVE family cell cycle protein, partial [Chloroflexota bacterium]
MTSDATRPATPVVLPRLFGPIRPKPRWQELRLLGFVAAALAVGSISLEATVDHRFALRDPEGLGIYLAALLTAHVAQVLAGRRTDQILLPTVAMLGGISLLLMERLPQDLVSQTFFGMTLGLAQVQLVWLLLGLTLATTLAIVVRSDSWLRRYKYTWAAVGVGLLLLTFVLGTEINGQRLTIQLGPVSGQPTELLKVILVVFLAGYLSENRSLLMEQDT